MGAPRLSWGWLGSSGALQGRWKAAKASRKHREHHAGAGSDVAGRPGAWGGRSRWRRDPHGSTDYIGIIVSMPGMRGAIPGRWEQDAGW